MTCDLFAKGCLRKVLIFKLWYKCKDNDEFARKLEEHGIPHYKADRAVIVPAPALMLNKKGWCDDALALFVFGDPASGCMLYDVVVVTGDRFGVDDILLNGQPIYSVHEYYGSTFDYAFGELERFMFVNFAWDVGPVIKSYCIGSIILHKIAEVCLKILKWLFRKWGDSELTPSQP